MPAGLFLIFNYTTILPIINNSLKLLSIAILYKNIIILLKIYIRINCLDAMKILKIFLTLTVTIIIISIFFLNACNNIAGIASPGEPVLIKPAADVTEVPNFNKDERILILAPHPDDEALANAGIIQRGLKAGAHIKVAVLTSGDYNSTSLPFIEKTNNPIDTPEKFLKLGQVRQNETISAMKILKLNRENIIFLGYPDYGTMDIFLHCWNKELPYQSESTKVTRVSYPECLSYGAEYKGENILKDLESIISDFKPEKIFVSSPFDSHKDHRALYLFTKVVLWVLEDKISQPQIFTYIVHVDNWPPEFLGLSSTDDKILPPQQLISNEVVFSELNMNEAEEKNKYNSIQEYKSQLIQNASPFYLSFVHKNELFCDFADLKLIKSSTDNISWQSLEIFEKPQEKIVRIENLKDFYYAADNKNFYNTFKLTKKIDKDFELIIYLIGYNKNTGFAEMPKLQINITSDGCKIFDQSKQVYIKNFSMKTDKEDYFIKIPIKDLGDPQIILSCVETKLKDKTYENTAWRVIEIN